MQHLKVLSYVHILLIALLATCINSNSMQHMKIVLHNFSTDTTATNTFVSERYNNRNHSKVNIVNFKAYALDNNLNINKNQFIHQRSALSKNPSYMVQRKTNLGVQIEFHQQNTYITKKKNKNNNNNNKQCFNMQIINTSTSNVSTGLGSAKSELPMDTTTKYFDSSSIKKSSPRHNSTFNSTVEEAILVSSNAAPLRQIAAQSEMTAASPIVSPPYTTNFQDVRSENIVLIPTPSSLEQYRLQLYNYALSIDRLRWPQYTAAAAIPATTYARGSGTGVHLLVNGESNHAFGSIEVETESNYLSDLANTRSGRPYAPATIAHGNRLALSMSLFPQRIFHTEEPKPQYSYIGLIAMAILSSAEAKLVLSDIYQYILDNYPYFRARGPGWRNSIRHNLSLNDCFIKSGRSANGKGHYWAIHPANIDDFRKGDFRRRKAQRKVRKHMGLSLDDAGTDSPSPPPLDLTSPPLTSARLLRLAPTGNALAAGHEFVMTPNAHAFGCLQQKSHPMLQVPTSLVSLEHAQQHIQDSYFGAAIMEQYTCIPSTAYTSRHLTGLQQQQHNRDSNENQLYNQQTHDNALRLLSQQSIDDDQKNAKLVYANQSATTIASNSAASAIASLYSQTRKRQFDVASLLAPDRKDFTRKISTTGRHTPPSFEESTALQPMFIKKTSHEIVKECHQQQQDAPTHVRALRSSYSCSNRQAFPSNSVSYPQRLLTLDEQDQDEIDVVENDIEEQSKKPYSKLADKDDEDPYDAVEEEERRVMADTKSDSSSGGTQVYVDGENECIIDATVHKIPISRQQPSPLPGAVIEWHMLRPQLTSEEKDSQQFSASSNKSTISQKEYKESYATKIISSTTVTPIAAPKVVTSSTSVDCNRDPNSNINQTELYSHAQNSILPNTVIHRNQHVRRLMHHLHQQHTHHDALEELDDETAQAFGHYYGTYMAAAARRIGTMQLTQIQHQFPVKHPQLQQQEASHQDQKIWH